MSTFECTRCGHAMEVPSEQLGRSIACPKCGVLSTARVNQPDAADQRGTAAGGGANPVVLAVVGAVILAFAFAGLLIATGTIQFGPKPEGAATDLQDQTPTSAQKIEANVPSPTTQPGQEPGDNAPSVDPIPREPGDEGVEAPASDATAP